MELYFNPNKGILKSREDDQNDWYFNKDLEEYLTKRWSMKKENPLPTNIRRILVIGNDLELKSGVFRSLASYINFLYQFGGYSIKTIELSPQIDPQ